MTASAHDDDVAAEGGRHPRPEGRTPRVAAETRGPRMNAAETIAAAIQKLERLRSATPVGASEWVRASDEDARVDVVVTTIDGDWIIRDGAMNFADADLIVTLHRTIDAQLAILRLGARYAVITPNMFADAATDLARAILGGVS